MEDATPIATDKCSKGRGTLHPYTGTPLKTKGLVMDLGTEVLKVSP